MGLIQEQIESVDAHSIYHCRAVWDGDLGLCWSASEFPTVIWVMVKQRVHTAKRGVFFILEKEYFCEIFQYSKNNILYKCCSDFCTLLLLSAISKKKKKDLPHPLTYFWNQHRRKYMPTIAAHNISLGSSSGKVNQALGICDLEGTTGSEKKYQTQFWASEGRPSENEQESLTFFSFSEVGLSMVSSGRLGLGLGESQELKKDWINGSRCCPFWQIKHII